MWLTLMLAAATYRAARFAIRDSLIDRQRLWFQGALLARQKPWRLKLYELTTCPYCLTVWFAAGFTALADQWASVPLPWLTWLAASAGSLVIWNYVED